MHGSREGGSKSLARRASVPSLKLNYGVVIFWVGGGKSYLYQLVISTLLIFIVELRDAELQEA